MKSFSIFSLSAIAFIFLFSSCQKKKDGTFTLQVNAKYGDQTFALNSPNTDPQGRRVELNILKFYMSHITLVKNDNSELELKDVALIDFSNPNTLTYSFDNISGDFKAIKFGNGVDSLQNLTDPNTISDASNPLGDQSMYWGWLKYLFEDVQGRCDTTSNGSGTPNLNWAINYHIGTNPVFRQTELLKSFSVCCNTPYTLNIILDVKKIFYGDTQTLDIITQSGTQMGNGDNPAVATTFVNNFSNAFSAE